MTDDLERLAKKAIDTGEYHEFYLSPELALRFVALARAVKAVLSQRWVFVPESGLAQAFSDLSAALAALEDKP